MDGVQEIARIGKKDVAVRAVKIIDIGYIAALHFMSAFVVSEMIDRRLGKFDRAEADKKSLPRLFAEVVLHVGLLGVLVYVLRNLVELVPYPFDGFHGFSHKRLKELSGGVALTFSLFYFQYHLKAKMDYLAKRINKMR
ncbi:hypothetical protein EBT31_01210 [bacterium]|nr:hypothetical protein [bacterium]NBX48953.1 hypothetical protein [bacterium]